MDRLTTARIRSLKESGRYGDGAGLYLLVQPSGTKSWIQRISIDGKRTDKGLGGFPTVSLTEARRIAEANRVAVKQGVNPWANGYRQTALQPDQDVPAFRQAALRFYEVNTNSAEWTSASSSKDWLERATRYLFPKIGERPVNLITAAELRDTILLPVAATKPPTATRLRTILKQVFEYAVESEWIDQNPIDRIPAKRIPKSRVQHLEALPWEDAPALLDKIRYSGAWKATRYCLEFLMLTATRSSEARARVLANSTPRVGSGQSPPSA